MADTKISAMTAVSSLVGAEALPVVQSSVNMKATVDQIFARANLYADVADTLALRRSSNTQVLQVYKAYTSSTNYQRLAIYNDAWGWNIASQNQTATSQDLRIVSPGVLYFVSGGTTNRWYIDANGHLAPNSHNSYDIGSTGQAPQTIYAGTSFRSPAGSAAAVGYGINAANTGWYSGAYGPALAISGGYLCQFPLGTGLFLRSDGGIVWATGTSDGDSGSVRLKRDADNILALRDGTGGAAAQTFRVYKTNTNISTDYERLAITGDAITVETAGTGTDDIDLSLVPAGTGVLKFGTHTTIASETITGYITVKDSGGTSRKLAVIS